MNSVEIFNSVGKQLAYYEQIDFQNGISLPDYKGMLIVILQLENEIIIRQIIKE